MNAPEPRTRNLAGLSLIGAPLLLLLSALAGPHLSDDGPTHLSQIAGHESGFVASRYLLLIGIWVLVPGLIGLWSLFRDASARLGQVGAGLVLIGWISSIAFFGLGAYEYEAAQPGLDRGLMGRLVENVNESAMMIPFIVVTFVVGIAIGSLIVAWTLWRRRLASPWVAAALVVWTLLDIAADSVALSAVAFAFLLAGFGSVGLKLLSMSDHDYRLSVSADRRANQGAG